MSKIISHDKQAGMGKRGWLKRNFIPLSALLLVIVITIGIFFYRERIVELGSYGYLGDFLISLACNATVIIPIPSITMLFAHGAILYPVMGLIGPVIVGLAGGAGGAIGELTGYMVGYSGRGVVESSRLYSRLVGWLKRWGAMTIFIFSLVPFFPFDLAGIAAGVLRFPLWKFILACWSGRTILYIVTALLGGYAWEAMLEGMHVALIIVLAVLATWLLLALGLAIENWTWKRSQ